MASRPPVIGRRYQLHRKIGTGGMGAVWLAVDEVLGREVAVKRVGMFPGGTSPDLLRAQREAKLAARLNHPHVVSVFDFVTEGDEQWLVMEYVAGTNLSVLATEQGGLPAAEAAEITGQVAEALAAAHSAGIVHRDVKPSNVLVTDAGTAKLADFGIARARADSTLTDSGVVTGTPSYLAPEVASGANATEASDVWSLGATLFHTLTGRPPYDVSDNVLAAMYRIVHEDPPRLPGAGWPAALLEHTMATDPQDRWPMDRVREYLLAPPPEERAAAAAAGATETTAAVPAAAAEPPTLSLRGGETAGPPELPADDQVPERAAREPDPVPERPSDPRADPLLTEEAPPRRGRRALVLLLVLLVAGVAAWALLRGDPTPTSADGPSTTPGTQHSGPSRTPSPHRSATSSPTTSTPSATPSSGSPSGASGGSAEEMRNFVRNYIATALTDPAAAWKELTPRFQQKVGSYASYAGYWDTIDTATLRDVRADPSTMVVSYVITWDPKGARGKEDDSVVLDLVRQDGRYLIDRER